MFDIKTIIIVVLVVTCYYQWAYPDGSHDKLEFIFGPVHNFIGSKTPAITTGSDSKCPTIHEPVCGSDGKTYDNICLAAEADILEVTPGEC